MIVHIWNITRVHTHTRMSWIPWASVLKRFLGVVQEFLAQWIKSMSSNDCHGNAGSLAAKINGLYVNGSVYKVWVVAELEMSQVRSICDLSNPLLNLFLSVLWISTLVSLPCFSGTWFSSFHVAHWCVYLALKSVTLPNVLDKSVKLRCHLDTPRAFAHMDI